MGNFDLPRPGYGLIMDVWSGNASSATIVTLIDLLNKF